MQHPIITLSKCYPQLVLPITEGCSKTDLYRRAVLRGEPTDEMPDFLLSDKDILSYEATPAGVASVLFLEERNDFEHAMQALAYRCEPKVILPSVGATTISGLINWEKIRIHKEEYFAKGGLFWNQEFKRFTSVKENYCDTIILLSSGEYSAIPAAKVGLSKEEWLGKSLTIRKFHELTHFVCRRLYPDKVNILKDEVVADCAGLIAAYGEYDPDLAKLFLGIEGDGYRNGGRLEHYVEGGIPAEDNATEGNTAKCMRIALTYIEEMTEKAKGLRTPEEIWEKLGD